MKKEKFIDLPKPEEKIFKDVHAETKADEGEGKRILVAKISTPNTDRSKDRVFPKGAITTNFMKNPVVQFAHKYDELPIAKCTSLNISDHGILATVEFPEEGKYAKADVIYWMYKNGFLNAWSIGFMPDEYEANSDGGYDFKSWELFEFSSVPVPDNAEALTIIRSKGINVDALFEKGSPAKEKNDEEIEQTIEQANETIKTLQSENEDLKKRLEAKATTAGELKALFAPAQVEKKDVGQVIQLAYILDALSWYIYVFEQSEVSQPSIDKLNQALGLVLQVVQEQAELGKKSFDLADFPDTKEAVKILAKAGRTISAKHEEMLKTASDHLTQAAEQVQTVLSSVAAGDTEGDDGKGVQPTNSDFMQKLANSLKTNNQKQDLTLRLLKEIKGKEGGDK
jgi:uncharacterized protein